MKKFLVVNFFVCFFGLSLCRHKKVFSIDERWVCTVKLSCLDCLVLPHCSWCQLKNKCFNINLPGSEDYCKDNATHNVDYGMGFKHNAMCACQGEEIEKNCYPPGVAEGPECSNRGKCECGRCVCDESTDPEHPSKTILGEYCEFDNFSCDGPRCSEGPYYIHQSDDEESSLQ